MSVINPNETARSWKANTTAAAVQLYLSEKEADGAAALVTEAAAGFPLSLNISGSADWIEPSELDRAAAAVIQVDAEKAASVKRFEQLAKATETPLIAAAYEPPLALVRSLIRAGAHDVIPLPVSADELEASLGPIREALKKRSSAAKVADGKLVSMIKAAGGVGATALLSQFAIRFAHNEARHGREVCLIDFDVQFGDVAFQLGLQPKLSLSDLLDASGRLDGDLLRATTVEHPSGLRIIAAPTEMMPLEGIPGEQMLEIVDAATKQFETVLLDLPGGWTNWSLSLVARSDLALLVTELTVTALNRARRQLNLLETQGLGDVDVRVIVNRYDKALARSISLADAGKALNRAVSHTIANDFSLVRAAIDRGVPVSDVKRKTNFSKDLDALDESVAAALRLER